jgi:hypothetical protein
MEKEEVNLHRFLTSIPKGNSPWSWIGDFIDHHWLNVRD